MIFSAPTLVALLILLLFFVFLHLPFAPEAFFVFVAICFWSSSSDKFSFFFVIISWLSDFLFNFYSAFIFSPIQYCYFKYFYYFQHFKYFQYFLYIQYYWYYNSFQYIWYFWYFHYFKYFCLFCLILPIFLISLIFLICNIVSFFILLSFLFCSAFSAFAENLSIWSQSHLWLIFQSCSL